MKQFSEDREDFYTYVFSELKSLGVKVPKVKKFKSSIPKQDKAVAICSGKTFGVCLCDQEKVSSADFSLPKFIVATTSYLKSYTQKEIGLFRKAGSISRQRELRAKLERGESIEESEPNDVASLLKQWLRELPESLIPPYLHDLFIRCSSLEAEENKVAAVLMCCLLLPPDHLHTLKHLLDFLSNVSNNSDKNKMGAHNLALIMAPNIFVTGNESIDKSGRFIVVQQHTSIVELLIIHAQKIGEIPACSSSHLTEADALRIGTDLDSSIDLLDYSPSKSKKKRGSGTVHDLFSGIRKLVGQNSSPNSHKRSTSDDAWSILPSVSRSASKRKADPEVQSMSPAKKQAVASNVLPNEAMVTPNNKGCQNVFGLLKEKTGSNHSRRKSFGLLRRKDKKRQKSSKSSAVEDPKVSINTPSPFGEKLSISLQEYLEPKLQIPKSSPLLSQSDIDKLFSKTSIVKKSVSDCYLTVPDVEFKDLPVFPSFPSEGSLNRKDTKKSPYNLRSESTTKQAAKRKLDVMINEKKPFDFQIKPLQNTETHNIVQDISQSSYGKCPKLSPLVSKTRATKVLNLRTLKTTTEAEINIDKTCNILPPDVCIQNCSVSATRTSNKRISSQRKRYPENIKEPVKITRENNSAEDDQARKNKDVSNHLPVISSTQNSTVLSLQNDEKIQRKHSINRQEAFRIKQKSSRKPSLSQVKSAEPTVFSDSRPKNITKYHIENSKSVKNNSFKQTENAAPKDKENDASLCTPDKREIKRNVRNGSIVRGRPNTIKTGLPSDLGNRFNSESVSVDARPNVLTSTTSVDNDLFINVVNHTEKSNQDMFINIINKSENNDHDISITLQIQNMTLSSPPESNSTKLINTKENIQSCGLKTEISVIKDTLTVSKKKNRGRICSNSDSKVHKTRRRSSKVTRTNSFPEPAKKSSRIARKLRAINSSSPKNCQSATNEIEKENPTILDVNQDIKNNNVMQTPNVNGEGTETWVSGRTYLEAEPDFEEDAFNKRESIAMILKNNTGHVQAKVHMYDFRSRSSSVSTPGSHQFSTPADMVRCSQSLRMSQRKNASSLKSNKSGSGNICDSTSRFKSRNFPLPPPPKFVIPDLNSSSPKLSYPLKELTNISNGEDMLNTSSLKNSFSTPIKDKSPLSVMEDNSSHALKVTRTSFSGHTPYKIPTVSRSESSPVLVKVTDKLIRKSRRSLSRSPSLITVHDYNLSSFSSTNHFSSPVFKTRSAFSIEKLQPDQLIDEWQCEM